MKKFAHLYLQPDNVMDQISIFLRSLLICTVIALTTAMRLSAQELTTKSIKFELNKDALKASKKGELLNAGAFWNQDQSLLHNFFIYTIKKKGTFFQEFTVDSSGKVVQENSGAYNTENLAKYNLSTEVALTSGQSVGELAGQNYGYVRKLTVSAKPKIIMGTFEDRYENAVWNGYKFVKGGKTDLGIKFWPAYAFAYNGDFNNTSYLLRKKNALGRALTKDRRYIPENGKIVIGGLKASTDPTFVSGLFDLSTKTWTNKIETPITAKSLNMNYLETEKSVYTVLTAPNDKYVLEFDYQGNFLSRADLSLTGNIYALRMETLELKTDGEDVFVIGPKFDKPNVRKNPGLAISKIKDGKEVFGHQYSHDELKASIVKAPKSKQKLAASSMIAVETINKLKNGDYMVVMSNKIDPVTNYFIHLSANGDLIKTYQVDGIPGDGVPVNKIVKKGSTHVNTELIEKGDALFAIIRTIPQTEEMGTHVSTTETKMLKTTTTVRVDELKSKARLVKIDLNAQKIAKHKDLEGLLIGTLPFSITKSGTLLLHSRDKKGNQQLLVVE